LRKIPPSIRREQHMNRIVSASLCLVAALAIAGCEAEGWGLQPVSVQNNTDQTIILRRMQGTPPSPSPIVTVAPHETGTRADVLPTRPCYGGFDLADTSGRKLRELSPLCGNAVVVYP
jgi:hypothetical protein